MGSPDLLPPAPLGHSLFIKPSVFNRAHTVSVLAPTFVAEVFAAATLHVVTPLTALNPKFTVRTLLELLACDEVKKSGVYLFLVVSRLVLLTSDILVIQHAAVQTVVLRAEWATELFTFFVPHFVVDEGEFTVGRGTPRKIFLRVDSRA